MTMQSSKSFSLEVEKLALEKKITHMEAVLEYCKDQGIEPDSWEVWRRFGLD